jgi:hypothetical protein
VSVFRKYLVEPANLATLLNFTSHENTPGCFLQVLVVAKNPVGLDFYIPSWFRWSRRGPGQRRCFGEPDSDRRGIAE